MPKTVTSHHFECDVPDDAIGVVSRYIAGLRGITNVGFRPNGTKRAKGEKPSKENEGSKRDVITSLFKEVDGPVATAAINAALSQAGYSTQGYSTILGSMIRSKLIKKNGRGSYVPVKAK